MLRDGQNDYIRRAQMKLLGGASKPSALDDEDSGYTPPREEPYEADPYKDSTPAPKPVPNYAGVETYEPTRYTEGVARRGGSTGGGGALSGAAQGAAIGSMVPGLGTAIGGAVGGLVGALKGRRAASAPTDYDVDDARAVISRAYADANGVEPEAAEVDQMIRGQGWKPGDRFVGEKGMNYILDQIGNNAAENYVRETGGAGAAAPGTATTATATAKPATTGAGNTGVTSPAMTNAPAVDTTGGGAAPGGEAGGTAAGGPVTVKPGTGGPPPGFDAGKWDSSTSPKYITGRALSGIQDQLRAIPDEQGRKDFMQEQLTALIPELEAAGAQVLDVKGEKLLIDAGDGKGPLWIDTIRDIEGDADVQWIEPDGGGGGAGDAGALANSYGYGGLTDAGLDPALSDPRVLQQIMAALANVPRGDLTRQAQIEQLGGK